MNGGMKKGGGRALEAIETSLSVLENGSFLAEIGNQMSGYKYKGTMYLLSHELSLDSIAAVLGFPSNTAWIP